MAVYEWIKYMNGQLFRLTYPYHNYPKVTPMHPRPSSPPPPTPNTHHPSYHPEQLTRYQCLRHKVVKRRFKFSNACYFFICEQKHPNALIYNDDRKMPTLGSASGQPPQWETRQALFPNSSRIFLSPLNINDGFYFSCIPDK